MLFFPCPVGCTIHFVVYYVLRVCYMVSSYAALFIGQASYSMANFLIYTAGNVQYSARLVKCFECDDNLLIALLFLCYFSCGDQIGFKVYLDWSLNLVFLCATWCFHKFKRMEGWRRIWEMARTLLLCTILSYCNAETVQQKFKLIMHWYIFDMGLLSFMCKSVGCA